MKEQEVFKLWQRLAGAPSTDLWGRDEICCFFQCFRPHGEGLDKALLPLPQGKAILDRMAPIFAATADGCQSADSFDAYFIVRKPPAISAANAEALVRRHLKSVAAIALSHGAAELFDRLRVPSVLISYE